jgi:hypothetical protein
MAMVSRSEVIETTAGEAAAELARRGIDPTKRVTIMIDGEQGSAPPGLSVIAARMRATAAARGLTTEIFDRLLKQP